VTSGLIFLISFIAIAAGIATGMLLHWRLDEKHVAAAKETIRLGASFLATLSAVLISLMIASAKSSYDTKDSHFRQLATYLVEADRLLSQYRPESKEMRLLMRQAVPAAIDRIWREKRAALQDSAFTSASLAEQINGAIAALTPANDAQRALKVRIELAGAEIARTRLLMFSDGEPAILTPFLLILIFWLAVVFASYSLFVEQGRIVIVALLDFALSISSALFLVADLSQPFVGLMQLPREQLGQTLGPLD
jgi:hypothetical protein